MEIREAINNAIKEMVFGNLSNPAQTGSINPINQLKPEEVPVFRDWWDKVRAKQTFRLGYEISPDPFSPMHEYDYISAFRAGVVEPDQNGHMPSQFKTANNPRANIDLFGQKYDTRK